MSETQACLQRPGRARKPGVLRVTAGADKRAAPRHETGAFICPGFRTLDGRRPGIPVFQTGFRRCEAKGRGPDAGAPAVEMVRRGRPTRGGVGTASDQ